MCETRWDPAGLDDAALNLAITASARADAVTAGQRFAAIAELATRRLGSRLAGPRQRWRCDPWDSCAAEIGADLVITHRKASAMMYQALDLRDRLPRIGDLLRRGHITPTVATTASWRTQLIEAPHILATVDAELAAAATRWGAYSADKLGDAIDAKIEKHDPDAVRRFRTAQKNLNIRFGKPDDTTGNRSVYGLMDAATAEIGDRRQDALAHSVCPDDPRTHGERRVAAYGIIMAGGDVLPCLCGKQDCPATGEDARGRLFDILILTDNPHPDDCCENDGPAPQPDPDADAPDDGGPGDGGPRYDPDYDWEQHWTDDDLPDEQEPAPENEEPGRNSHPAADDTTGDDGDHDADRAEGESPEPSPEQQDPGWDPDPAADDGDPGADGAELETKPEPTPDTESCTITTTPAAEPRCAYTAIFAGGGVIPLALLADLCRMGATVRTVARPEDLTAEPRYRPSVAAQRLIRARDMTCRFPGCNHPAEYCDTDHTVPYGPGGLTHPGNTKMLCRKHHLLKTFWVGEGGWSDEQLADGTIVWTSPSGLRHRAPPGSAIYFPNWDPTTPLPDTPAAATEPTPDRERRMPQRTRTRARQRAADITAERTRNRQLDNENPAPF